VLNKLAGQIKQQRKEIATLKRDEQRLSDLVVRLAKLAAKPKPSAKSASSANKTGATGGKPIAVNTLVPEPGRDGTPFSRLKGLLRLPARGELMNQFGTPREGGGLSWKGLFIRAPEGSEVRAVAQGTVAFAEWLRGFGNLLIVDHGEGYMSLYSNNESLYKQAGDPVKTGETIASVGNSGGQESPGVYFELRHQSRPINPMAWIK
jgi:septal ring factor EnvC (AmiA/AmiB activator)